MTTLLRAIALAVGSLIGCLSTTLGAAPQEASTISSASVERIRQELDKRRGPRLKLDGDLELPVATFKTSVERRRFTLTLEEELHKEFDLNLLQRQSADWASRCCGYNLNQLANSVKGALHRRKVRRIRQQVERDLAEVVGAAAKN